ncbi:MAG: hypothetical protein HDR21_13375 [Lachnospiraceae bacterium]|nr:hypothetical protein [Lachnospiraceae bacterium]
MWKDMLTLRMHSPMLGFDIDNILHPIESASEFVDGLIQGIFRSLYEGLYNSCESSFSGLFDSLNKNVGDAAGTLTQTPQGWSEAAYNTVKSVSENAFLPIAASFITVIFCWELIRMVQDSNSMQHITTDKIVVALLKLGVCLMVCSKAFDIVMAFFELGASATTMLADTTENTFGEGLTFSNLVTPPGEMSRVSFSDIMEVLWYLIIIWIGRIMIIVAGCIIYVRCVLWFLELLIYSSAAPIPYSTWMNKEWSQVGMNYTRKMLSLVFQGPFMLLLFAIYGGVLNGIQADDFTITMIMVIGCGFALNMMMFKVSTITDSIFNAH